MTHWRSFGASVRGPGHVASGTPNQDAWVSFHHTWGDGIVVSDGLGSRQFSEFGSEFACRAVVSTARACLDNPMIDRHALLESIKANWLSLVAPLEPGDFAATCLFAFRLGDGVIHLGMLGDGLAAVVKADGTVVQLADDKSQGFSNITTALSTHVTAKDWQYLSLSEKECAAVLLCTDGVADDLDDIDGFVKGFIAAYQDLAMVAANRHTREMLENWPTPKHSDDKTLACLCRQGETDE